MDNFYKDLYEWVKTYKLESIIIYLDKVITYIAYILYVVLIIGLLFEDVFLSLRVLLTTSISFALVTLIRKKINMKRPYEVYNIEPLIEKDTKGNSFPSRHVFSIFIIAMSFSVYNVMISGILFILGTVLCFVRVLGGVHYIKDVIWGMIIGILCAVIGIYII